MRLPHSKAADTAVRPDDPVVIVVAPVGRGKFRAWIDGGPELVPASSTPLLTSCRKLLILSYDPHQQAMIRHIGSDVDALSATVGAAAKVTVAESSTPRFVRLRFGLSQRDGSPSIAETDRAATSPASKPERTGVDGARDMGAPA